MLSSPFPGAALGALLALSSCFLPGVAHGAPCPAGTVARAAAPDDNVCVSPASRRRAAADNARAPLLWVSGPFGPKTCAPGFVWREAFAADTTCVTTAVREETLRENAGPRGDLPR
ncbi:hypothetical protein E7V67_014635 [[Empedobacter] haloabium]|uniref:Uncharacterized protein n=1 Tax=[Empedobacter] haloabium TaxID=592317 RepID=A0ABZ1UDT4_9BURK